MRAFADSNNNKNQANIDIFLEVEWIFFFFSFVEKGKELINHWVVTRERYYKKRKKNRRNDIAAAKVKKNILRGVYEEQDTNIPPSPHN